MPVVIVPEGPAHVVNSIARDGTMIGGRDDEKSQNPVLWVMTPGSSADSKPRPFRDGNLQGTGVEISPDGRWVAHTLGGSGGSEVYVVPYAGPGERVTVSTGGGANARWSAKGRELFYRSGDKMMVVDVPPGPAFRPGRPRMLFERSGNAYDVAPDGRFLMIKPVTGNAPEQSAEMHIVVNWIEELRRRVPPLK
jgi:Tol biopolymer transport system component